MSWKFQADQPIYTQLVARLQQQIVSGVYPPGSKLPSVRELEPMPVPTRIPCSAPLPSWSARD